MAGWRNGKCDLTTNGEKEQRNAAADTGRKTKDALKGVYKRGADAQIESVTANAEA
jgi:hypothetical protein